MKIYDLQKRLVELKIPNESYSLLKGGLPNEQLCIIESEKKWEVYYSERGIKSDKHVFESEEEACDYFLKKIARYSEKINKEAIIKQYIKSGEIIYHSCLNGNYIDGNRESKKLRNIFKQFEKDRILARECICELINNPNIYIKTEAAAYCLALKENVALGIKILEEIANNESNGIFSFNAKMTLKVWKEEGKLLLYKGQN
jgi:hypothetical protein